MSDENKTAPEAAEEKKEEVKAEETKVEEAKPEEKKEEAPKEEEKKEEAPEEKKEVPAEFKSIVEAIEKLSVLELAELVKVLEDRFGVSAAAPVAIAAAGDAGAGVEEKSEFDIELTSKGSGSSIGIIKIVREITGQGLKDAKDMVDAAPKVIKENVPKAEAEEIKAKIEEAGGSVTLK